MAESKAPPVLRILLVEDNEHDRVAFYRALKKGCPTCEITHCIRAEEAPEQLRARARDFNLLVVDYKLPGMSGMDLCRKLLKENIGLPMVLMTGMGSEQLAVEALKMGVADYIVKDPGGSYLRLLPLILPGVVQNHAHRFARLKAEDALRKSEEKSRMMVENAYDAIFIIQGDTLKFPNPRTVEMLGYSDKELEKIPFPRLFHPHNREKILEKHEKDLQNKQFSNLYSLRLVNKRGEELWADLNAACILWEDKPAVLYFLRDITEKKQLEAQLLQVQKMQALGTMAGGVAHDFNNLLMCILSNVTLIFTDTGPGHPHYKELKNIEQCVQNGAALTRQLLGFARGGKYEVIPTDLNRVIEETAEMFQHSRKGVTIHKTPGKKLNVVEVDQGQITQVLLNIFLNARQAMTGGGDLYIRTANAVISSETPEDIELKPGDYAKITIRDTGEGMDKEICLRIFEPFFTTREPGKGIGLGLASAYGIVKNHGGIIRVASKKGKGTTFDIYLPASAKKVKEKEQLPPDSLQEDTGTILFVDDEEMLIEMVQTLLKRMGYEVLIARDGAEAIEVYKKNKNQVNLVIMDIIMPGISAAETYTALRKINPGVRVLLASGYGKNGHVDALLQKGCSGFIQKPFYMKELSKRIKSIMES